MDVHTTNKDVPAHYRVEGFVKTLVRHFFQPKRKAAIDFTLPSGVLAPVLMPQARHKLYSPQTEAF